jgi:uncharacterized membrane protein HdeD (DUF308 family)
MLLIKNWWLLALRGISSVIFGVYFFVYPELTLELLFKGFCLYAFIDGTFCILAALLSVRNWRRGLIFLFIGLISIAAGMFTLYQPLLASVGLLLSVGLWAILTGILEITSGLFLKDEFKGTKWLIISGAVSIIVGVYLLVQPLIGFASLATLIGIFQIIRGIVNVMISFGVKHNRNKIETELENLTKS